MATSLAACLSHHSAGLDLLLLPSCLTAALPPERPHHQCLYIGDHIYGDILRSKKSLGWRTMLVSVVLPHG